MLLDSLGDWDWCSWACRVFPKGSGHAAYQRHRALARDLIWPYGTAARFSEEPGAGAVAELWRTAPEPRAYGDLVLAGDGSDRGPVTPAQDESVLALLHMQHNRLLGIDRAREGRGFAILRGIARDTLGRRAHEARRGGEDRGDG